jgi:hypothetical protein
MRILLLRPVPGNERFGLGPFFRIEPLGMEYIAAALEASGHRVTLVDLRFGRSLDYHVSRVRPDLVGIAAMHALETDEVLALWGHPDTAMRTWKHDAALGSGLVFLPGATFLRRYGALHIYASPAAVGTCTGFQLCDLSLSRLVIPGLSIPSVSVITTTRDVNPARDLSEPPPLMKVAPLPNCSDSTLPPRLPPPLRGKSSRNFERSMTGKMSSRHLSAAISMSGKPQMTVSPSSNK